MQHPVGRKLMPGTTLAGLKAACSHVLEIVVRIAVELDHADFDQWVILVRPDLGEVEGVIRHLLGIQFRHDLYVQRPFREVASLDGFVEIAR